MVAFSGALALMAPTGCIDSLAPDVGPLVTPACSDTDADPSVDVSFARDVLGGVFTSAGGRCLDCHAQTGATPIGIAIGGLDLSTYGGLRRGGVNGGIDVVIEGSPCASVLVQKVGPAPPFGARMPLEGPALTERDRQLLVDWIAEGARDN